MTTAKALKQELGGQEGWSEGKAGRCSVEPMTVCFDFGINECPWWVGAVNVLLWLMFQKNH